MLKFHQNAKFLLARVQANIITQKQSGYIGGPGVSAPPPPAPHTHKDTQSG